MTISSRTKLFFALILILCVSLTLYYSSLNYFFFQDDFFEINISRAGNLNEYLNFFKFRNDIIAYRPISLQNYFFLSRVIFGLNPIGYRIFTFVLLFLSSILIAKIVEKITANKKTGLLASFFWVTSSIHFMSLSWIAAGYNIIGTFFWLLTSVIFLNYLKNHNLGFYILSILVFLLTVGSFEFSVTWPIIFSFYFIFVLKNPPLKSLKILAPFILIAISYLFFRLIFIKVPKIIEYQVTFNLDSVKALFWYFLWSLNIPEEFKKQAVNNLIVFNSKFLSDFWLLVLKNFIGAIWIVALGITLPLFYIFKQKLHLNNRLIVFSIFWFVAGVFPVLILPNHTFTMYLTFASIGIYFLIAYLITVSKRIFIAVPILGIWLFTSYTTLSFYKVNSWMINAQKTAHDANANLKQSFPTLPANSAVYYPLNSHWEKQALSGHAFIKAIYNDSSLLVYYNKYDLIEDFNEGLTLPVNIYLPR